jgi:hypothetical protein
LAPVGAQGDDVGVALRALDALGLELAGFDPTPDGVLADPQRRGRLDDRQLARRLLR